MRFQIGLLWELSGSVGTKEDHYNERMDQLTGRLKDRIRELKYGN
jgi:hypothetical protein